MSLWIAGHCVREVMFVKNVVSGENKLKPLGGVVGSLRLNIKYSMASGNFLEHVDVANVVNGGTMLRPVVSRLIECLYRGGPNRLLEYPFLGHVKKVA